MNLIHNVVFWAGLCGWFVAQFTKLLCHFVQSRKIDFRFLISTGGMPSAHSAMACGLATAVALVSGMGSPLFAVTLAFAIVVMFDAQTVRRAAGVQARVLNQIVDELFTEHHLSQQKLKEFLGHTPLEVFFGMVMGILMAIIVYSEMQPIPPVP